jgi:hypothetical protein
MSDDYEITGEQSEAIEKGAEAWVKSAVDCFSGQQVLDAFHEIGKSEALSLDVARFALGFIAVAKHMKRQDVADDCYEFLMQVARARVTYRDIIGKDKPTEPPLIDPTPIK